MAVTAFIEACEDGEPGESLKEALVRSAFAANEAVLEMAARSGLRDRLLSFPPEGLSLIHI